MFCYNYIFKEIMLIGNMEYKIYNLHYEISGYPNLYASVSADGLIESEILLKENVRKRGKSIDGYVLYSIENAHKTSDKEEVISNTLMEPAPIVF
jgi:hypothetical protein